MWSSKLWLLRCTRMGQGVSEDLTEAVACYKKGAELGKSLLSMICNNKLSTVSQVIKLYSTSDRTSTLIEYRQTTFNHTAMVHN